MIKRRSDKGNKLDEEILKSIENRVCNSSSERDSKTWYHTIDSTGVHQFNEGDLLDVHYQLPSNANVGSRNEESYFGVFMV